MTTKTYAQLGTFSSVSGTYLIAGWDPAGPGPLKTAAASVFRTYFQANLGTAALKDTGTSGDVVTKADGANTWSAQQTYSQTIVSSADTALTWNSGDARLRKIGNLITIDFSASGGIRLAVDLGSGTIDYRISDVPLFSVDSSGNAIFKGTVTQNGTPT